ncbi:Protein of unknown function [Paraoerskovia marina]|uniref:DUF3054 domain-containing protein n=1 Tax=Paraoerskovia marina TaxID=545619 RepID=A0A1H1UDH3_9CELL|nr:DUF3054 domain-containing protein [Paraoerskovia marina]SDS70527.1 Protein of unknown function [Paraoerskovia marina]
MNRPRPSVVLAAAAADLICVLALAVGGYQTHDAGSTGATVLRIVWPFAAGLALGWLVSRAWRRPTALWPTGVVVWGCAWAGGVVLRVLTDQGAAPAFQIVSFGFLAVTLLGWRGVVAAVSVIWPSERRHRAQALRGAPPRGR